MPLPILQRHGIKGEELQSKNNETLVISRLQDSDYDWSWRSHSHKVRLPA